VNDAARARVVVGVLMCLLGGVWFLQGIGVLEGSFMTGQWFWTVVGLILLAFGVRMVVRARRGAPRAD
jgi:hypothetical protein